MIDELVDISIEILEDIFKEEHCEVEHDREGVKLWCAPCTHQVVAILEHRCSGSSGKVCQATVDSAYAIQDLTCRVCKKDIHECWVFTPI